VSALRSIRMVNESLIYRCIRQEPKAQYELYRALYPQMMSITTRYERIKQDAVARMNQGFLKILTNIGDRRAEVPFELWTRRVMINTVIDSFRRDKRRKAQEALDAPVEFREAAEANDYLRHIEADALSDLLLRVPPMSRNVFNSLPWTAARTRRSPICWVLERTLRNGMYTMHERSCRKRSAKALVSVARTRPSDEHT